MLKNKKAGQFARLFCVLVNESALTFLQNADRMQ